MKTLIAAMIMASTVSAQAASSKCLKSLANNFGTTTKTVVGTMGTGPYANKPCQVIINLSNAQALLTLNIEGERSLILTGITGCGVENGENVYANDVFKYESYGVKEVALTPFTAAFVEGTFIGDRKLNLTHTCHIR